MLDHEGQLIGTIDATALETANLGAMPIEAAKAADIAMTVTPLHSQMSEQEVLDRLVATSADNLPVVDATTGRMIGIVARSLAGLTPPPPLRKGGS